MKKRIIQFVLLISAAFFPLFLMALPTTCPAFITVETWQHGGDCNKYIKGGAPFGFKVANCFINVKKVAKEKRAKINVPLIYTRVGGGFPMGLRAVCEYRLSPSEDVLLSGGGISIILFTTKEITSFSWTGKGKCKESCTWSY